MNIQLIPGTIGDDKVKKRITETIEVAEAIRGCVAFWVIGLNYFGPAFTRLLNRDNSFYCIDIHKPTNLNSISDHYNAKAKNLFLHLKKIKKPKDYPSLPKHLLHAKIMLFDLPNQQAEIWVGSHNFTNQALSSINIEASTVITCDRDSDFYKQVNNYLEQVKNECERFDPYLLDIYKAIQNENAEKDKTGDLVYVIPIIGRNIDELSSKTVMLLGRKTAVFDSLGLGRVNKEVYVHALDLNSGKEALFKATVRNSGSIVSNDTLSYNISFSDRLYTIHQKSYFPYESDNTKELTDKDLKKYGYWANIAVERQLYDFELRPITFLDKKCWKWVPEELTYNRLAHLLGDCGDETESEEEAIVFKAVIDKEKVKKARSSDAALQKNTYPLLPSLSAEELQIAREFYQNRFEETIPQENVLYKPKPAPFPREGTRYFKLLESFRRKKLAKKMRLIEKKDK